MVTLRGDWILPLFLAFVLICHEFIIVNNLVLVFVFWFFILFFLFLFRLRIVLYVNISYNCLILACWMKLYILFVGGFGALINQFVTLACRALFWCLAHIHPGVASATVLIAILLIVVLIKLVLIVITVFVLFVTQCTPSFIFCNIFSSSKKLSRCLYRLEKEFQPWQDVSPITKHITTKSSVFPLVKNVVGALVLHFK